MNAPLRRTKIICTLGPATFSEERIGALIKAGMDVARLNFSHGEHSTHRKTIRLIRKVAKASGREVGILQDLQGPKIRVGELPDTERTLQTDERVFLVPGESNMLDTIPVRYAHLLEDVSSGDRILLADGRVELVIEGKKENRLIARVQVGGVIHSHKGVNLPSTPLRIPAFTKKDRKDLALGMEEKVDFVALSFVRHEKDLQPVRRIMERNENRPLLIAKIEKPQALDRLEQILDYVDGIMVARGDLGVEMPLEKVPMVQKRLIHAARKTGKPVITATQMLRSMMDNPRPTRAEATDVANAILDGTDALMLSEETAIGQFPRESVQILDRIARATEPDIENDRFLRESIPDSMHQTSTAISRSACWLARDVNASVIAAFTTSGNTARLVARFRPSQPVVALTNDFSTQRQLTLSWGIIPSKVRAFKKTDKMFSIARGWLLEKGMAKKGDRVILTAGVPVGIAGTTNLLKVIKVE